MKKRTLMLLMVVSVFINAGNAYSQCIPDTVTCRDTLEPGQICPEILPDGHLGQSYNQTVTILPPASAVINEIPFIIVKIKIDTITNLPPGIVYEPSAIELYPDTAYCVLLSGTPTETGEFKIAIKVVPYVDFLGSVIEAPAVVNDTSVKIFVHEPTEIEKTYSDRFDVLDGRPNPFSETTELGIVIDIFSQVKLNIYNYIGVVIYSETLDASPGRNFFKFTGGDLGPGYYIYSITNKQKIYSDKLIKTR
jgi:hypothetical protein